MSKGISGRTEQSNNLLPLAGLLFIAVLIANLALFAMQKTTPLAFYSVVAVVSLLAAVLFPRMKKKAAR